MGYYLSQVRLPRGKKLYWFRSDGHPVPNTQCIAWAKGRKESGIVVSSVHVDDGQTAVKITGRPFSSIAPLISYAKLESHDGASLPIDNIRVPSSFQMCMPQPCKIAEKYQRILCGEDIPLIVEKSTHTLRDGYASFLVYRMLGRSSAPIIYVPSRS